MGSFTQQPQQYKDMYGNLVPYSPQQQVLGTQQAIQQGYLTNPSQYNISNGGALTRTEGGYNLFGTNFFGTKVNGLDAQTNSMLGNLDSRWSSYTPEQQGAILNANPELLNRMNKMGTAQQQQTAFASALNKFDASAQQGGAFSMQGMFGKDGWVGGAGGLINTATSLYGAYLGHQNMKLQKANFEEQKALARANFKNTARQYNTSLRALYSSRGGYIGASSSAKQAVGKDYRNNKVEETY